MLIYCGGFIRDSRLFNATDQEDGRLAHLLLLHRPEPIRACPGCAVPDAYVGCLFGNVPSGTCTEILEMGIESEWNGVASPGIDIPTTWLMCVRNASSHECECKRGCYIDAMGSDRTAIDVDAVRKKGEGLDEVSQGEDIEGPRDAEREEDQTAGS